MEEGKSISQQKEAATLIIVKRETAERERKGKKVATPGKRKRLSSASKGIVIQEPLENLSSPIYDPSEEQKEDAMETSESEEVFEKFRVTVDHKLLEAMVHSKDPKKQKNHAGGGQKEEDEAGDWADREIGQPEDTEGFNVQTAWRLMTMEDAALFKTSVSKGTDIINPILRLAQVFLVHNLLGQVNGTITTAELYFMWCMLTDTKVHLGYWIVQALHKITRHLVRHLYACHLLGVYLQRNVEMTVARPRPIITMCDTPDWFDTGFFINSGLVTREEAGELHFYQVGQGGEAPIELDQETEVETTNHETEKEVEENSTPTETKPGRREEKWQEMM